MIENNELEKQQVIAKIDKATDEIRNTWADLNSYDLKNIDEAWNDPVCKEYINKVQIVDNTINKIINNLDALKECWEKYRIDDNMEKNIVESEEVGNENEQ